jgi:hypothetical protein
MAEPLCHQTVRATAAQRGNIALLTGCWLQEFVQISRTNVGRPVLWRTGVPECNPDTSRLSTQVTVRPSALSAFDYSDLDYETMLWQVNRSYRTELWKEAVVACLCEASICSSHVTQHLPRFGRWATKAKASGRDAGNSEHGPVAGSCQNGDEYPSYVKGLSICATISLLSTQRPPAQTQTSVVWTRQAVQWNWVPAPRRLSAPHFGGCNRSTMQSDLCPPPFHCLATV